MRTDRSHVLFHNTCKASSEGVNKSTCGLFCEGKSLKRPSILYVKARFWWCTATRIGLCWTLTGMKSQARKTDISELAVMEVEGRLLHHLIQKHALERTTKITRSQGVYTFCTWGNSSPYQQVVVVQIFIICLLSSLPFLFMCTLSDFWQHVTSTGESHRCRTHLQLLTARNWTMVICSFGLPSVEMDWDWENVGLEKWKKKAACCQMLTVYRLDLFRAQ